MIFKEIKSKFIKIIIKENFPNKIKLDNNFGFKSETLTISMLLILFCFLSFKYIFH